MTSWPEAFETVGVAFALIGGAVAAIRSVERMITGARPEPSPKADGD